MTMLKVSFKDTAECPAKKVDRYQGKTSTVTVVTLTGSFKFPCILSTLPQDILDWLFHNSKIIKVSSNDVLTIKVIGKASKVPEDEDNPVLGERIAEARAKTKLYKFMYNLARKLAVYYQKLLYGNCEIRVSESHTASPLDCLRTTILQYNRWYSRELLHLQTLLQEP